LISEPAAIPSLEEFMRRGVINLGISAGLVVALAACSGTGSSATASATASAAASGASGPTIEVTGSDYKFEGLPTEVASGTQLTFKNAATDEDHMIIVVRKNDDTTRELEDLLKNGTEEEQQSMTTMIGQLEANPGQAASGTIKLDQPGQYLALCPIPVGSMSGPASDAMPHYVKGMYQLFTVK
jgi:plastocyanin